MILANNFFTMKYFKIALLFLLVIMNFLLYTFPFVFHFDSPNTGWWLWFAIPFSYTILLGDIVINKGCWFFKD